MNRRYERSHLLPEVVLRSAVTNARRERTSTADLLADLVEIDASKLYLPLAYPSLCAYCMGELRLSEDAAAKRIQAARAARRFPAIFDAVAEGRLHLTGVCLLAPHLTEETAAQLLAAATHRSKAEIQRLLAERFPRSDVFAWVVPTPCGPATGEHAPAHVEGPPTTGPGPIQHAPAHVGGRPRVTPLSGQSYALQVTLDQGVHDDLRYAQALLGHRVPSGDITKVLGLVLKAAIRQLEKQKFAVTNRPRASHRNSANPRHIPAHVKRAVLERDGARCTFVSEEGHRCPADTGLEFDHVLEVARGGEATVEGIRLLCRAHNQYAAERTFGPEFMRHQRIAAAEARAAAKQRASARTPAAGQKRASANDDQDVIPWLRALGFNAAEARRAAERCEAMAEAPIEERVRVALTGFRAPGTRNERPTTAMAPA